MSVSHPATEPHPAQARSAAGAAAELLRLSLSAVRCTGLAAAACAAAFVLVLLHEGQWIGGALAGAALAGGLAARGRLCRHLLALGRRERQDRAHWFTGAAAFEGCLWSACLLLAAPANPAAALIHFEVTLVVVTVGALTYGIAGGAGVVFGAAVALGQLAFLLLRTLPLQEPIALGWVLTLAAVAALVRWLRGALGELLLWRGRAEQATRGREQAAEQLRLHRERLRLTLEAIDAGVADTDLRTGERFLSARYAAILGGGDCASLSQTHRLSESLHPEDRTRVLAARRRHINEGERFEEEFRLRTAAGTDVWVHGRGESVRGSDGRAKRFVLSIVDITARRSAERQLAASERRYRALVDASPSLFWMCDSRGQLTYLSPRALRQMYGYEVHEVLGRHVLSFNAPGLPAFRSLRRFRAVLRGGPVVDVEMTHLRADGQVLSVQVCAQPQFDERGRLESVIGVVGDITTLRRREAELNRALLNMQAVFEAAGEGIAFVRDGRIESANPALSKMLDIPREWMIGRPVPAILSQAGDWDTVRNATEEVGARGEAAIHEVMLRAPDGAARIVWCQLTSRRVADDAMILVLTDITLLKRREELAWHQANHDELTGLPNRRLLVEQARRLLSAALRQRRLAALMVLDLDGFKEVNDRLGHGDGDRLLQRVALRLSAVLREHDLVARVGGDEFVVLLPEIDQPAAAIVVAEKLIAAASERLAAGDGDLSVHASVGVALFPSDGYDFDTLNRRADAAMYEAKGAGKNQYRLAGEGVAAPVGAGAAAVPPQSSVPPRAAP